jgi:hypothetical protein
MPGAPRVKPAAVKARSMVSAMEESNFMRYYFHVAVQQSCLDSSRLYVRQPTFMRTPRE